mmetsp:Transcript_26059/g.42044  ORF Transcript_26059/g.42044 Transcript_26059/m.42044 type:complete len:469 (-) Transcript_26059:102-1508(-)
MDSANKLKQLSQEVVQEPQEASPACDLEMQEQTQETGAGFFSSKWFVLSISCLVSFLLFYTYDNPSATLVPARVYLAGTGPLGVDSMFSVMYSATTLPTIFLLPFIGRYLDDHGLHKIFPVCIVLLCLSQSVVSLGIQLKIEYLAIAGRAVYGVVFETASIICAAFVSNWMGARVALGMSMLNIFKRLGSCATAYLSLFVGTHFSIPFAFWMSAIFWAASLFPCVRVGMLENKRRKRVQTEEQNLSEQVNLTLIQKIKLFNPLFWCLCLNYAFVSGIMLGFNTISSAFLTEAICNGDCCPAGIVTCTEQADAETKASFLMSIPFITQMCVVSFFGMLVDRIGKRGILMQIGFALILVAFGLLMLPSLNIKICALVIDGLGLAMVQSSVVPSFSRISTEANVSTTFAVAYSLQSLVLTILPLCISALFRAYGTYNATIPFLGGLAACCCFSTIFLNILDFRADRILHKR